MESTEAGDHSRLPTAPTPHNKVADASAPLKKTLHLGHLISFHFSNTEIEDQMGKITDGGSDSKSNVLQPCIRGKIKQSFRKITNKIRNFTPQKTEETKKKKRLTPIIPLRVFSELYLFSQHPFFSWLYPPISE